MRLQVVHDKEKAFLLSIERLKNYDALVQVGSIGN